MKLRSSLIVVIAIAILCLNFGVMAPAGIGSNREGKSGLCCHHEFCPPLCCHWTGFHERTEHRSRDAEGGFRDRGHGLPGPGTLDAGGIGITAATFNAFNKGFDLRIVGSAALQPQKGGPSIIIVRKDLKDSGKVKSVADLKGMKVGIAGGPGTTGAYFVAKALKDAGLTIKDIEIVNLANPDLPLGFEKAID